MIDLWGLIGGATRRLSGSTLGASGEKLAANWLRRRRYRIIHRNLTLGDDEADLVALDPDGRTLVIVEVKTRASADPAPPEESVGHVKQRRLARLAARLQQSKRREGGPVRFDVIAIVWPEDGEPQIRHIPAAFDSPF